MPKKLFSEESLKTLLGLLEFHINKMIELQRQEDAVPNPPDFQKKVEVYELTAILKGNEKLQQEIGKESPEGFDFKTENENAMRTLLQKIINLLGVKPPDEWVFEYPFKTEGGRDLESHLNGVSNCWDDLLHFPYLTQKEKDKARQTVRNCLALLEENFPDLVNSDSKDKAVKARHHFIIAASFFLNRVPEDIGLSTRSFIRHLRRRLRLWLKYQCRRLFSLLTR